MSGGRQELAAARKELAQALGGDVLDQNALNAALARVEGLFGKARVELNQALTDVHSALDGRQRKALAELIADGFPNAAFGHGHC
jgi:uncharacterized membrane protein